MKRNIVVFIWHKRRFTSASIRRIKNKLTAQDLARAEQISSPKKKYEFLCGRYMLRSVAGVKAELRYQKHGKPYFVRGPEFSISHSDQNVVLAVGETKVGVDLENIKRKMNLQRCEAILSRYATAADLKRYQAQTKRKKMITFLEIWGRIESAAKMTGAGLRKKPNKYFYSTKKTKNILITVCCRKKISVIYKAFQVQP